MIVLVIEAERTAYSSEAVVKDGTATIRDLKRWLEQYDDDDDTPVVLSHDHGYTYGPLNIEGAEEADTEP